MGEWWLEVRSAVRRLAARPGAVIAAVVTVGIGIGANLALASVALGFFYQERETPESSRVLWVGVTRGTSDGPPVPPPGRVVSALESAGSWDGVAGWSGSLAAVTIGGETSSRWVRRVTPRFYELQGIRAAAGRLFGDEATEPLAVLGSRFARAHFGSESAAVGGQLRVDGIVHDIVGVLEASYDEREFGVSVLASRPDTATYLRSFVHFPSRELREAGRAELSREVRRVLTGSEPAVTRVVTGGEKEVARGPGLPFDPAPFGLSLILLLTAGFNLAAIMLARGQERVRSAALRRLLGAGRWRLVRPLVVESAIVATLATLAGLLSAALAFRVVDARIQADLSPVLSPPLVALAGVLTVVVILLTGIWPALATQVVEARGALRERATSSVGRPGWLRGLHVLLTAQFVLAVPVVSASLELTGRALAEAERGVGFDPTRLAQHTRMSEASSEEAWEVAARLERRVAADGAVDATALVQARVLTQPGDLEVGHGTLTLEPAAPPRAPRWVRVSPAGLQTLGVPLTRGRWPTPGEAEQAVVVNETAAGRWFPDGQAIGGRVRLAATDGPWLTVVGVVGDVRDQPLIQETAPPALYGQLPVLGRLPVTLYARGWNDEAGAVAALRAALDAEGPGVPGEVRSTEAEVHRATAGPRLAGRGALVACTFVVLLVATGLHGLMSVIVSRRTFDLAVRVALGARVPGILRSVLGAPMATAGAGIALGWISWHLVRAVTMVGPVSAGQTPAGLRVVFGAVLSLVFALALARPLRRALQSDPVSALRASE